jgi:hypothetical protein
MKGKKYSENYLNQLWRKAVLADHGNRCAYCGNTRTQEIECHHIVKRRHKILRWEWRNGIPGCRYKCHMFYHTKAGELWIAENHKHYKLLLDHETIVYKQYLLDVKLTDAEFRELEILELKTKIKEHKNEH